MPLTEYDLDKILERAVFVGQEAARVCFDHYEKNWFPCGNAHIVLRGQDNRRLINAIKKRSVSDGYNFWRGDLGTLMKAEKGYWWSIPLAQDSQSLGYKEEIYRAVRNFLATENIEVELDSYID